MTSSLEFLTEGMDAQGQRHGICPVILTATFFVVALIAGKNARGTLNPSSSVKITRLGIPATPKISRVKKVKPRVKPLPNVFEARHFADEMKSPAINRLLLATQP